jgi:hypothetical protein
MPGAAASAAGAPRALPSFLSRLELPPAELSPRSPPPPAASAGENRRRWSPEPPRSAVAHRPHSNGNPAPQAASRGPKGSEAALDAAEHGVILPEAMGAAPP